MGVDRAISTELDNTVIENRVTHSNLKVQVMYHVSNYPNLVAFIS